MRRTMAPLIIAGLLFSSAAEAEIHMVAADLPPFSMSDSADKPGFVVELAQAAFERARIPFNLEFMPWARAQNAAKTEPDTVILCLTRTPDRENDYKWVVEVLKPKLVFVSAKPTAPVNSFDEARSLAHITVRASTNFEEMLRQKGILNIETVQKEEQNAQKLEVQHADAWLSYDLRARWVWRNMGADPAKLVIGKSMAEDSLQIGASKNMSDDTAVKISAAVEALRQDGTYRTIYTKYFGED